MCGSADFGGRLGLGQGLAELLLVVARHRVQEQEAHAHGLVRVVDERRWGGLTERVLRATAASYVISAASLLAIRDQERAGLDIVTDGEMRLLGQGEMHLRVAIERTP